MGFKDLRKLLPTEEFDYQTLVTHLPEYSNKRDVITRLLKHEKIVRVKKGIYIFGPDYREGEICKEALANQIYGPSYISFEYALSFYGMISEKVEVLTSATIGRNKKFFTPIGSFSYQHLSNKVYSQGITLKRLDNYHSVLFATPEKALLDLVYTSRGLTKKSNLENYFEEDLRIDHSSLTSLSLTHLQELAHQFSSSRINRVVNFIRELQNHA